MIALKELKTRVLMAAMQGNKTLGLHEYTQSFPYTSYLCALLASKLPLVILRSLTLEERHG